MIREEIVSQADLLEAVSNALERKGTLQKVKAHIRAEVYHTLEDKSVEMPSKPKDVFIAFEIIREFLINFQFDNTTSVFCEESGQPDQMLVDREFIAGELGLNATESNEKIPLLVLIIQYLSKLKRDRLDAANDSLLVNRLS